MTDGGSPDRRVMWPLRRNLLLLLIGLAIFSVPGVYFTWIWFFQHSEPDPIGAAMQRIGFYPVKPPSQLYAPGSIYYVSHNGKWTSTLCEVDPQRLKAVIRTSPTEQTVSRELRKATIGMDLKLAEQAKSEIEAKLLQNVDYVLENVEVQEVSLEELGNIAAEMQQRKSCLDQIINYLNTGEFVCQAQQVLKATAHYSLATDTSLNGKSSGEILQAAIKARLDPSAQIVGERKVAGTGLYYGIKLTPRCMALLGQYPRRPPTSFVNRMLGYAEIVGIHF